ncbi:trans-aconitate methyltransferase [Fontibacillus phaseoli]|uniref:Trans-aconitate methyltransferase n=1 Tax=Fontibacillus phaseoli TaxID=1416533 RepID=A0A369B424_9BACL|nr:class I SAM-dependent methyltransferase [Fontibacillus phaseoli]RCX16233.1 trans-aconitate methyltransferase [Fontibacillus phaseoli]
MSGKQVWHPGMYDEKLGYVAEYGKGVVELLRAKPGEQILDLGCGTGDLTQEISKSGAGVLGMDLAVTMIEQARIKYPHLNFKVGNAEDFELNGSVDAVFSNAALHWMKNARGAAGSVWNALRPGGRFVAEFGGKGNVAAIVQSLETVLEQDYGIDAGPLNPWYFPSLGEYSVLLEELGFRIAYAAHFDRPTKLGEGEDGLIHWLNGFAAGSFLAGFKEAEKANVLHKVAKLAKRELFRDGEWFADYVRLRIVAVKHP